MSEQPEDQRLTPGQRDPLKGRPDDPLPSGGPSAKRARLLSLLGNIKSGFDEFIENAVKDFDHAGVGPDLQDFEAVAHYLHELGLTADAKRLMAMRKEWVEGFTNMGFADQARNMSPEERANLTEIPAPEEDPKIHAKLQEIRRLAILGSAAKSSKFLGGLIDHVEAVVGKPPLNERRTVLMTKAEAARILTGRRNARGREVKQALARYEWRDEGNKKGTLRLDKMDTETAARFRGKDKVSHGEPLGGPRKDA